MKTNNKNYQGFTLVELMITVAIIGILAAVALPFYNDYTIRTKIAAGIRLASPLVTGVTESYSSDEVAGVNAFRVNLEQDSNLGLVAADRVESLTVSEAAGQLGTITITFDSNEIPALGAQNIVRLSPHINGTALDLATTSGTIKWECSGETGSKATNKFTNAQLGTVKSRYLPNACR